MFQKRYAVALSLAYEQGGMVIWASADRASLPLYAAKDPSIVRWYQEDQVINVVRSDPLKINRVSEISLTVHGLETEDCPSGVWLVDVGLGDALHEPIPLHEGTSVQGPFRYQLRHSAVEAGGWRLDHDPAGSFAGVDFCVQPATMDEFTRRHLYLSLRRE